MQEVQTVKELQVKQAEGHATQLLEFDKKLELPQLKQTEGLLVEQAAQLEKHCVQFVVPLIFT
jgi:hypothetical protein